MLETIWSGYAVVRGLALALGAAPSTGALSC